VYPEVDLSGYFNNEIAIFNAIIPTSSSEPFIVAWSVEFGRSGMDYWNPCDGKRVLRVFPDKPFDAQSIGLVANGEYVVAVNGDWIPGSSTILKRDRLYVWQRGSASTCRVISFPDYCELGNFIKLPGADQEILVGGQDKRGPRDAFYEVNIQSGKYSGPIYRKDAIFFGRTDTSPTDYEYSITSPDCKLFAVCDGGEEGGGEIEIFDAHSLKPLSKYTGQDGRVVGPYAFLGNEAVAFGNRVWNLRTNKISSLFVRKPPSGVVVAFVPSRPTDVFLLTTDGLQLWNNRSGTVVKQWPQIAKAEHIFFTLDGKGMYVFWDKKIQYWDFDQAALR
jgi:hypothetical protein